MRRAVLAGAFMLAVAAKPAHGEAIDGAAIEYAVMDTELFPAFLRPGSFSRLAFERRSRRAMAPLRQKRADIPGEPRLSPIVRGRAFWATNPFRRRPYRFEVNGVRFSPVNGV